MPWRELGEASSLDPARVLMPADLVAAHQHAFGHLLERDETVQNAWLLRRDSLARTEVVCVVSERHYYVIRSRASTSAAEVLLFGPLGVKARVEREGLSRFYLVLEEQRLPLKRRAVRDARALAAAIATGSPGGTAANQPRSTP